MRTIWCDSVQPDMSSNFDRAVGGEWEALTEEEGRQGPVHPWVRRAAPRWPAFWARRHVGLSNHNVRVGARIQTGTREA